MRTNRIFKGAKMIIRHSTENDFPRMMEIYGYPKLVKPAKQALDAEQKILKMV